MIFRFDFERLLEPLVDLVVADLEKHLHDVGVRTAVKRARQSRDAGGDAAVHSGQRARNDTRRECRSVQLVIGVQDQANVEHMFLVRVRTLAAQHIKEILRDRQAVVRSDRLLAVADAVPRRGDRADLAGELTAALTAVSRSVPWPSLS